nr:MAG TPA: Minor structural protein [Caudoviricetes sp.]
MYKVSEALANTLAGNSRCMRAKLVCGSEVIDSGIQSIKLVQQANADNETVSIGGAVSAYAEISIYKPLRLVTRKEYTLYIGAVLPDDTVEYCKMGLFTPKKPQEDDGLLTFKAYDRMVSRLWKAYYPTVSKYPADGKEILTNISKQCGIAIANLSSLPAGITVGWGTAYNEDGSVMKVPPFTACTIREALSYLAQMYGAFATINRDGEIEFRWYAATSYEVPANRSFDDIVCAEQVYKLQGISCTVNDKTIMAGTVSSIQIENSYMTQNILNSVYKKIGGFSFLPTTFSFLGDPRLDLGDIITVYRRDGTAIKVPVMSITFDFDGGLSTEVGSYGSDVEEGEDQVKGPTTKALERVYTDLFLVRQVVADKVSVNYLEANYATITELDAVSARIDKIVTSEVTVEYLEANYAKMKDVEANFATIDLANVKDASIKSAMIDAGAVKTVQIADGSITDAKIVELTANKITAGILSVERLELVGSTSSIVYALNNSGELVSENVNTLDGDVLTDRTITADKLVANSITANEIASKTITANEILANTITSAELAAGSVTADKISVSSLESIVAKIGGFNINQTALYNGTDSMTSTKKGIYIGIDGIRQYRSDSSYATLQNGKLTAVGADIKGNVYLDNGVYMYFPESFGLHGSITKAGYYKTITNDMNSGSLSIGFKDGFNLNLSADGESFSLNTRNDSILQGLVDGHIIVNTDCETKRILAQDSISTTKNIKASGTVTAGSSLIAQSMELSFSTPFIDFHYNKSSADFTSRLIDYGGNFTFYTTSGIYQFCNTEGNHIARIHSNGTFGAASGGTAIVGSAIYCQTTWSGGAYTAVYGASFTNPSSRLVKENIINMSEEEAKKILLLNPVDFDYIKEFGGEKNQRGLIAEDVLNIIPSCVTVPEEYSESDFAPEKGIMNKVLAIDYSKLIPYLIKIVQMQQEEIEALKHA